VLRRADELPGAAASAGCRSRRGADPHRVQAAPRRLEGDARLPAARDADAGEREDVSYERARGASRAEVVPHAFVPNSAAALSAKMPALRGGSPAEAIQEWPW